MLNDEIEKKIKLKKKKQLLESTRVNMPNS
jgi:hypothetical protein